MTAVQKRLRYYYWLVVSFIKKNAIILALSFWVSFLVIFFAVNWFPYLSTIFFKKQERVGIIGRYQLNELPVEISNLISNPLIKITEGGELVPVLASSWEVTDEGRTYIFHLKPNLLWSDGKAFNAADLDLRFEGIETNVIDTTTIKFKLNKPLSIFPIYLTRPIIKYPLKGVGGAYRLQSYRLKKNRSIANISLFPSKAGLPYKTYVFYDTEDELIRFYKKGQINTLITGKKSVADFFSHWKNTHVTRKVNYNQIVTLFFNTESELLADRDVRKAFAYASPKFAHAGVEANGSIPPASWAYESGLKKYTFDFDKALTYLKKDASATKSAELDFYTFYDYISVAESLKKNFSRLGFTINLKVLSYVPDKFDMLLTAWSPPTDPDQYYFWHSTQKDTNITHYKNIKVDKLLEDGRKIINLDERKKLYRDFQQVIVDDLPAYFIYYPYVYTIERR